MEDELWLKKIKDKLEDYSEPLPVAGWERLEKELSVSGAPITGPHRMIPFRRWAVAAAAVLLVAVSSVSLWLLQSPVSARFGCGSGRLAGTDSTCHTD